MSIWQIGSGLYGTVYVTESKSEAIKVYVLPPNASSEIQNTGELDILFRLRSNFLVQGTRIYAPGKWGTGLAVGMERLDGTFSQLLATRDWARIKRVLYHYVLGVGHLHSAGYFHLDISRNNCMYTESGTQIRGKLIDFGMVGGVNHHLKTGIFTSRQPRITVTYRPPECFDGTQTYTDRADVWSLGVLLYEALCDGRHPLPLQPNERTDEKVHAALTTFLDQPLNPKFGDYVPKSDQKWGLHLLRAMLSRQRVSLIAVLNHPFFQDVREAPQPLSIQSSQDKPYTWTPGHTSGLRYLVERISHWQPVPTFEFLAVAVDLYYRSGGLVESKAGAWKLARTVLIITHRLFFALADLAPNWTGARGGWAGESIVLIHLGGILRQARVPDLPTLTQLLAHPESPTVYFRRPLVTTFSSVDIKISQPPVYYPPVRLEFYHQFLRYLRKYRGEEPAIVGLELIGWWCHLIATTSPASSDFLAYAARHLPIPQSKLARWYPQPSYIGPPEMYHLANYEVALDAHTRGFPTRKSSDYKLPTTTRELITQLSDMDFPA